MQGIFDGLSPTTAKEVSQNVHFDVLSFRNMTDLLCLDAVLG